MHKFLPLSKLVAVLVVVFFLLMPVLVFADGFLMIKSDPYGGKWGLLDETGQQAFISYSNNVQKMIISIGHRDAGTEGAVWLFPIPAEPNKITIDAVKSLPELSGEEVSGMAKLNVNDILKISLSTQLYTVLLAGANEKYGSRTGSQEQTLGLKSAGIVEEAEPDVVVYKHLDKGGLSSEIITAKTANGLYNYLIGKGLQVEMGSISVLNHYIGKDYSFIATWINSQDETLSEGLSVAFPTKKIYFPLLPTSVYGSKIIPAVIRVIGHVTPKLFYNIDSYTTVDYYVDSFVDFTDNPKDFYNGQSKNIKYTKIEIKAPSKNFTDDLWINNFAPINIYYSTLVAIHPIVSAIVYTIIGSILASVFAGSIFFAGLRQKQTKLILIGLSNVLTIAGLIITTMLTTTKELNYNNDALFSELRQKGYLYKRKFALILFIIATPLLILDLCACLSFVEPRLVFNYNFIFIIAIYLLTAVILSAGFIFKKIKLEDVNLFAQLKTAGYSSWTFRPKDKMKILFIPVFSVFFIIIQVLLIKFIEFTV